MTYYTEERHIVMIESGICVLDGAGLSIPLLACSAFVIDWLDDFGFGCSTLTLRNLYAHTFGVVYIVNLCY